jgi:hypothetical protein
VVIPETMAKPDEDVADAGEYEADNKERGQDVMLLTRLRQGK